MAAVELSGAVAFGLRAQRSRRVYLAVCLIQSENGSCGCAPRSALDQVPTTTAGSGNSAASRTEQLLTRSKAAPNTPTPREPESRFPTFIRSYWTYQQSSGPWIRIRKAPLTESQLKTFQGSTAHDAAARFHQHCRRKTRLLGCAPHCGLDTLTFVDNSFDVVDSLDKPKAAGSESLCFWDGIRCAAQNRADME